MRARPWRAWLGLTLAGLGVAAFACTTAPLQAVAPGVWAWPGQDEDLSADNGGHIVTNVVVQAQGQAWVIDPGPTQAHGQALRAAIACQLKVPVAAVWNSHAHAENTLGNQAFKEAGVPIWATPQTQSAMRQRCPSCLAHVIDTVGEAAHGTAIVIPDHRADLPAGVWQAGPTGDSRWKQRAFQGAHSESDAVWWQPQQRVLIAAGLVYRARIPELAQGSLRTWIAALDQLWALSPRVVIGQAVGDAQDIKHTRRYLCALQDAVLAALARGETASGVALLALPEFSAWAGYDARQGFNTQRAWRELEAAWMQGPVPACNPLPPPAH